MLIINKALWICCAEHVPFAVCVVHSVYTVQAAFIATIHSLVRSMAIVVIIYARLVSRYTSQSVQQIGKLQAIQLGWLVLLWLRSPIQLLPRFVAWFDNLWVPASGVPFLSEATLGGPESGLFDMRALFRLVLTAAVRPDGCLLRHRSLKSIR